MDDDLLMRLLADSSPSCEMIEDPDGRVLYASPACETICGCPPARLIADPGLLVRMLSQESRAAWDRHVQSLAASPDACEVLLRLTPPGAPEVSVQRVARQLRGADGVVIGVRSTMTPAPETTTSPSPMAPPDREQCLERLRRVLDRSRREPDFCYAIFYLDIDRLKKVNDTLGPEHGDALIAQATGRVLAFAPGAGALSRVSGDEFMFVLEKVSSREAVRFVKRLLQALHKPYDLKGHEVTVYTAIGVVLSPTSYDSPEDLLRNAMVAMRRAKGSRHRFKVFNTRLLEASLRALELELDLPRGLRNNEFHLLYQPIISLENGRMTGVEALLRWRHPKWGEIGPCEFLPIAEETGFIVDLGAWVLGAACAEMVALRDVRPEMRDMSVSVNLSAAQLNHHEIVDQVSRVLEETGFPPQQLRLEITETAAMRNPRLTARRLKLLKEKGVLISIDDFGTGYSSLSYLQSFPVDTLKVDRSFVSRMGQSADDHNIVSSVISLAHNLRLNVVAEGVEAMEQWSLLHGLACEDGQGFLFSRPVTAQEIQELAKAGKDLRQQKDEEG